jgi:hypothetical protein
LRSSSLLLSLPIVSLTADSASAQATLSISAQASAYAASTPEHALAGAPLEAAIEFDGRFASEFRNGEIEIDGRPFLRFDPTGDRSRFDLTEASLTRLDDFWEVSIGMKEIAWGVAESRNPVDGLNQRELVGVADDYRRLGQLSLNLTVMRRWGTIDAFLLPWFRERSFTGHAGMLWSPYPVEASRGSFESGDGPRPVDWAIRWRHSLGPVDVSLTHLQGNLREPDFDTMPDDTNGFSHRPRYSDGGQSGLAVQAVTGSWVWKLEVLTADPERGRYVSAAGGLEYAIGDYLALFLEYSGDSRGGQALTSFQNDLFAGARLFLPDGQLRLGTFTDLGHGNSVLSLSLDWRLGAAAVIGFEAGIFLGDQAEEPALARRQHSAVALRLSRYF